MKNIITRDNIDNLFLRGYLDAALFTEDPNPPGGCDYVQCGRADEMYSAFPADFVQQARKDCERFQSDNAHTLECVDDLEQAGSDFWYDRQGHGVGARDRGYTSWIGPALAMAAKKFREVYLELELTNELE